MADRRQAQYVIGTSAAAATLTGAYSGNLSSAINIEGAYQVSLDVAYTMGSGETSNSIQLRVEFSPTGAATPWFQQLAESTVTGTTTLVFQEYTFTATQSAGTNDYIHISIPVDAKYMRIGVKETGIATNGGACRVILTQSEYS